MEPHTTCTGGKPMNLAQFKELSFSVDHEPSIVGFSVKKMDTSEILARLEEACA